MTEFVPVSAVSGKALPAKRHARLRKAALWSAACTVLSLGSAFGADTSLVLHNASIYTANDALPTVQAVTVVDGRIVYVGTTEEAMKRAPATAHRIDLHGRPVFPGFTDSHAHLAGIGERELSFDLQGTASIADLKQKLAARAGQSSEPWIVGRGWIETHWHPAAFPTRQDLDAVVSDRPVVLRRADGHALIANSMALARAAIDRNTRNPPGGEILKDSAGEPTGMLIDKAMELVLKLVPPRSEKQRIEALEAGATRSIRLGWTQLQNAGTPWRDVELLCELYRGGKIKLRLYNAINGPGADAQRLLEEGRSVDCSDRLTVRTIKLYIDGALGSRGAALLKPYNDAPQSTGLFVNDPEAIYPVLTSALRRGIQIETHAIGDRGNRRVLDLYERAFCDVPRGQRAIAEPRWRIEHAQVLDATDIPRFAKLGVLPSMQPSHAISDLFFAPSRLGPQRLGGAYAWRALIDTGSIIAAGSDAPVEQGNPVIEFYAAVARRAPDGFADENWHREQRVTRAQALKMLSLWPAYAAFQERERGSIEVGKLADFTVLSADIMQIPDAEILKAHAVMTIIGGEITYVGTSN